MNRLTTAAVLTAATSMLAVTSAFIITNFGYLSAKRVAQLAVSTAELKFDAKPRVGGAPAGQCRRLVGVWTTLGFELVIRPDDTAYDPGYGATGTITCVGQTAKVHWLRGNGEDERFTVSADDGPVDAIRRLPGRAVRPRVERHSAGPLRPAGVACRRAD